METDPNAFYTYDEYGKAVETLYEVVKLRGESIDGQLNGTIPSTADGQRGSDALVEAAQLDLSVMGSMNMRGGQGGGFDFGGNSPGKPGASNDKATSAAARATGAESGSGEGQPDGTLPEGFDPSGFGGQPPEGFEGEIPEDFDLSQFGGEIPGGFPFGQSGEADGGSEEGNGGAGGAPFGGQRFDPTAMGAGGSGAASAASQMENLILYGVCLAVLIAALLFAKLYRRKPRKR